MYVHVHVYVIMGVYNVYVKLMGMYVCECRCKGICIVIMGVYNMYMYMYM